MSNTPRVRKAEERDFEAICSVVSLAFADEQDVRDGQVVQSLLVRELAKDGHDTLSLVAEGSKVVGHVLLSPVSLEPDPGLVCAQVSPLSVLPGFQSRGIGGSLMRAVIEESQGQDLDVLFLLGNPEYYKRFGFVASKVSSAYGPSIYFQELVLKSGALDLADVHVELAPAFTRLGL